jgi:hypothetical protein
MNLPCNYCSHKSESFIQQNIHEDTCLMSNPKIQVIYEIKKLMSENECLINKIFENFSNHPRVGVGVGSRENYRVMYISNYGNIYYHEYSNTKRINAWNKLLDNRITEKIMEHVFFGFLEVEDILYYKSSSLNGFTTEIVNFIKNSHVKKLKQ